MSYRTLGTTLAAASLVGMPLFVDAQTPATAASTQAAATEPRRQEQAQTGAPTRQEVSRQTQAAMRDGSWRCLTNSRGWCGTPPDPRGIATGKDAAALMRAR